MSLAREAVLTGKPVIVSIRRSSLPAREEAECLSRNSHIQEGKEWASEAPPVVLVSVSTVRECPVSLLVY